MTTIGQLEAELEMKTFIETVSEKFFLLYTQKKGNFFRLMRHKY